MILPRYRVATSSIPLAGQGLFVDEPVARGRVILAPDNIHTVWPEAKLRTYPADSVEVHSSVRWFEDRFSLTPEWSDECYVNHSYAPTALWHLGFIFALEDLPERILRYEGSRVSLGPLNLEQTLTLKGIGEIPGDASDAQMDSVADIAERYAFDEIRVAGAEAPAAPRAESRTAAEAPKEKKTQRKPRAKPTAKKPFVKIIIRRSSGPPKCKVT